MRLTLVIPLLHRAGAERAISLLANAWVEQGKQVTLLTFDHDATPAYPLHPSVEVRQLGLVAHSSNIFQALFRNLKRIWLLRRAIRESRPDLVVSFVDGATVLTLLATRGMGIPVIVSERSDPTRCRTGAIWRALRRIAYPSADALVCLTDSALAWFPVSGRTRRCVIPNFVTVPQEFVGQAGRFRKNVADRVLVAMGRLVPEKGFDVLLQAFASIAGRHPEWSLKILGKGPSRSGLESQAAALGLTGRVHFVGEVAEPFAVLCQADLFVLSSRFEGFCNALCEAMACGLPVVSFDCPSGPSDIIRDNVDGLLVTPETADALTAALDRLMSSPKERARLAERAPEVLERFSAARILSLWQHLFQDVAPSAHEQAEWEWQTNAAPIGKAQQPGA